MSARWHEVLGSANLSVRNCNYWQYVVRKRYGTCVPPSTIASFPWSDPTDIASRALCKYLACWAPLHQRYRSTTTKTRLRPNPEQKLRPRFRAGDRDRQRGRGILTVTNCESFEQYTMNVATLHRCHREGYEKMFMSCQRGREERCVCPAPNETTQHHIAALSPGSEQSPCQWHPQRCSRADGTGERVVPSDKRRATSGALHGRHRTRRSSVKFSTLF